MDSQCRSLDVVAETKVVGPQSHDGRNGVVGIGRSVKGDVVETSSRFVDRLVASSRPHNTTDDRR